MTAPAPAQRYDLDVSHAADMGKDILVQMGLESEGTHNFERYTGREMMMTGQSYANSRVSNDRAVFAHALDRFSAQVLDISIVVDGMVPEVRFARVVRGGREGLRLDEWTENALRISTGYAADLINDGPVYTAKPIFNIGKTADGKPEEYVLGVEAVIPLMVYKPFARIASAVDVAVEAYFAQARKAALGRSR